MDRVKKLKVKKADGTFTDYIPVGADAIYVDLADGDDVESAIARIKSGYAHYYDNIESMKNDIKLKENDIVETLGFYNINDGGNALYKIRKINNNDVVDNKLILPLNNLELIAELIIDETLNVKKIGAYGDGVHDDTEFLQFALNLSNKYTIDFGNKNNIYYISSTLLIKNNLFLTGNYPTIKGSIENLIDINTSDKKGIIENLIFDNLYGNCAIQVSNVNNFTISNCKIFNSLLGINYKSGYELNINNCLLRNNSNENIEIINKLKNSIGLSINSGDSTFTDIIIVNFNKAIDVNSSGNYFTRIHGWIAINELIKNSIFMDCENGGCLCNECFNDSFYIGWLVGNLNQLNLVNCRNFWNSDYVNKNTLENPPYIFFIKGNINNSKNISIINMTSSSFTLNNNKPLFSNININEWLSIKNFTILNNLQNFKNIDNVPLGYITTPLIINENLWTITTNTFIISEGGRKGKIIIEATYKGEIQTQTDILLAHLDNLNITNSHVTVAFQKNDKYNTFVLPTYAFIQNNGDIKIKFSESNKPFIYLEYEFFRNID